MEDHQPPSRDEALASAARELANKLADPALRDDLRLSLADTTRERPSVLVTEDAALTGIVAPSGALEAVPQLELVAPSGLDAWSATTIPHVTFEPTDDAPNELVFFDAHGAEHARPANEQPEHYALMLRERRGTTTDADVTPFLATPSGTLPVYLRELVIWDTHECWGCNPEIYVKCDGVDKIWLNDVNDTGKTYRFNKFIRYLSDTQDGFGCRVMESDDSTGDDEVGRGFFLYNKLQNSSSSTCYGFSQADALMGVAKVKAYETFYFPGSSTPITVDAGCPYYYF